MSAFIRASAFDAEGVADEKPARATNAACEAAAKGGGAFGGGFGDGFDVGCVAAWVEAAFVFAFGVGVVVETVPEAAGSPEGVQSAIFVVDGRDFGVFVRAVWVAGISCSIVWKAGSQGWEKVV
jgi:hypothetical protein